MHMHVQRCRHNIRLDRRAGTVWRRLLGVGCFLVVCRSFLRFMVTPSEAKLFWLLFVCQAALPVNSDRPA